MKATYVYVLANAAAALAAPSVSQTADILSTTKEICPSFPDACTDGLVESTQSMTEGFSNKDLAQVHGAAMAYAEKVKAKPECVQPLIQCARQMNAIGGSKIVERQLPFLGPVGWILGFLFNIVAFVVAIV